MEKPAGKEVPVFTTDVDWLEVSIPSDLISQQPATLDETTTLSFAPPSAKNAVSGFYAFGSIPRYLIWRIHPGMPNAVELEESNACGDLPKFGLRVIFPSDLFGSIYLCNPEIGSRSGDGVQLYALTNSGLAICLQLQSFSFYKSCSIFPLDQVVYINLHDYQHHGAITAVAAESGHFLVGRDDGSVGSFQLQASPGHVREIRDDGGIARIWGLIARNKMVGAVQDIVMLEMLGRNLAFVIHLDGMLRVWDLEGYNRVFNCVTGATMPPGSTPSRLWVGEPDAGASLVPLAVLYRSNDETNSELVSVFGLSISLSDKINISVASGFISICLDEAKLIDVKFVSHAVWILKDDGLLSYNLLRGDPHL